MNRTAKGLATTAALCLLASKGAIAQFGTASVDQVIDRFRRSTLGQLCHRTQGLHRRIGRWRGQALQFSEPPRKRVLVGWSQPAGRWRHGRGILLARGQLQSRRYRT